MIPDKSHPRFRQLVTEEYAHSFQNFTAGMCVSRNQRLVREAGRTPESILNATETVHGFFVKYEELFAADLKIIFG